MKKFLKSICVLLMCIGMFGCESKKDDEKNIFEDEIHEKIELQLNEHNWDSTFDNNDEFCMEVYRQDEISNTPMFKIHVDEETRRVTSIYYIARNDSSIEEEMSISGDVYLDAEHSNNSNSVLLPEEDIKKSEEILSKETGGLKIRDLIDFAEDYYKDYEPLVGYAE